MAVEIHIQVLTLKHHQSTYCRTSNNLLHHIFMDFTKNKFRKIEYSINQGSQFVLVTKFQVISRFCPSQKRSSPGYSANNFGTKRQTPKVFLKTWTKLFQHNIEILYLLTFQVLSRFSAKFLVLSRFSHFLGQIPGYFWTWTDTIPIFRFSRFPGSTGNPDKWIEEILLFLVEQKSSQ